MIGMEKTQSSWKGSTTDVPPASNKKGLTYEGNSCSCSCSGSAIERMLAFSISMWFHRPPNEQV